MRRAKMSVFAVLFWAFCALSLNAQAPEAAEAGLSFYDAGRLAIEASKELKSQYAMIAVQKGAWVLGRRAYFPKLTLQAMEDDRLSQSGPDAFQKNYSLGVEQLLFDGGRLFTSRKIEKAKLALQSSQLDLAGDAIFEQALGSYRAVLLKRRTLDIQKRAISSFEEERGILTTRLELGMALEVELTEFDISIADTKLAVLSSVLELEEAETQFAELLGLEKLPVLGEKIDIYREGIVLDAKIARMEALARNPEIESARLGIKEKEEQAKLSSRSWLPILKANGSFSVRGDKYPLTSYNWAAGISIEFATPFISSNLGASYGGEGRDTKLARASASLNPIPDPAAYPLSFEPRISLALERSKFTLLYEKLGRSAVLAVERCRISDERRLLAIETARLSVHKEELAKTRFRLGQLTSLELLEAQSERIKKEIASAEAAAELLAAERELEKLLKLRPGELASFAKFGSISN